MEKIELSLAWADKQQLSMYKTKLYKPPCYI